MKYLKTYESILNYNVDIFTIYEARDFYRNFLKKHKFEYDLKDKIHYYSYGDFDGMFASDNYKDTCRLIIAHNDKDILGICKFANWDLTGHYAISYCSTNKDYLTMGVSKKLLETLFKYFSETYPNETLNFSGYSIEGWKYLRKYILEYSKKYNVKIAEKWIEYPGIKGKFDKEDWELMDKSREEIRKTYGKNEYDY